jgi:hypothetical protein
MSACLVHQYVAPYDAVRLKALQTPEAPHPMLHALCVIRRAHANAAALPPVLLLYMPIIITMPPNRADSNEHAASAVNLPEGICPHLAALCILVFRHLLSNAAATVLTPMLLLCKQAIVATPLTIQTSQLQLKP